MSIVNSLSARLDRMSIVKNRLNELRMIIQDPSRHAKRFFYSKEFAHPTLNISSDKGYLITSHEKIAGLTDTLQNLTQFAVLKQRSLINHKNDRFNKPFYLNILSRNDLSAMPELVSLVLSEGILNILAPYYGLIPNLSHIGLFSSSYQDAVAVGTQCAHWDNHDRRHVKMFCYLTDVTKDDGPLTFLPAEKSLWLRKKTGRLLHTSPFRDDSEWRKYFTEKDLIHVTGPSGTVAFLDTTRCLHFGSRCNPNGHRLSLVVHWTRFAEYSYTRTKSWEDLNMATSPELRPKHLDKAARLMFHVLD
jgi:hypothetical protein